jgi:retron-type reverse transcriptase
MYSSTFDLMSKGELGNAHFYSYKQQLSAHKKEVTTLINLNGLHDAAIKLAPELVKRATAIKYLRNAFDAVIRTAGHGAGLNRIRPKELEGNDIWSLCKATQQIVEKGWYSPGPTRKSKIAKKACGLSTNTDRVIEVQNIEDRILDRTAKDVYGPVLEPFLLETSFGRKTQGHEKAFAYATTFTDSNKSIYWVQNDIQAAFGNVEIPLLLKHLEDVLQHDSAVEHIRLLIDRGQERGLLTGSPLSPLLADFYFHNVLDQPWKTATLKSPNPPMLRYVDDLLIPCRSRGEADSVFDQLQSLHSIHGLSLKYPREESIVDIRIKSCPWLGVEARYISGKVVFTLTPEKRVHIEEGCLKKGNLFKKANLCGHLAAFGCCYTKQLELWLLDLVQKWNDAQPKKWRLPLSKSKKLLRQSANRWHKLTHVSD